MKQRCSLLLLQSLEDGCCICCTQIVADHEAKWRNLFQVGQLPNVCAAGVHQDGQLQPCSLMNKLRILVHGQFGSSCSMSTEVQRRRKSARTVERDPTSTSRSMKSQGVLVHALSGRVKFLGVYIAAVAISRQRQRELKGLDRRRRIIHRLRMLQKQRQNSWEKETERLVLGAWIRGYRKAIDSLKSHQTARQAIVDKATELGMRTALTLTEGGPTESSDHFKRLLEEEENHFSRQGWEYLPLQVKGAYENFLLSIDAACDELKVQAAALKRLAQTSAAQDEYKKTSSQDDKYSTSSSISQTDGGHFMHSTMDGFTRDLEGSLVAELQSATHESHRMPHMVEQNVHSIIDRIADPHVLLASYDSIKTKLQFAYLKEGDIWEDFDWNWFKQTAKLLEAGTYEFTPARQVYMRRPGKGGEMRSHVLISPRDQVVEEAIRVELENIYDPIFLEDSHGFRPGKSCHTALKAIKNGWKGTSWFLQLEINNRYGISNHKRLLNILSERLQDQRLLNMLRQMFAVGIIDIGGPMCQNGSLLSALLCNIYYHELDVEVAKIRSEVNVRFDERFDTRRIAKTGASPEQLEQNSQEAEYMSVRYIRVADEFLIGVTGSRAVALDILARVKHFAVSNLKLRFH
jgi:retron-type reverse transcriptase